MCVQTGLDSRRSTGGPTKNLSATEAGETRASVDTRGPGQGIPHAAYQRLVPWPRLLPPAAYPGIPRSARAPESQAHRCHGSRKSLRTKPLIRDGNRGRITGIRTEGSRASRPAGRPLGGSPARYLHNVGRRKVSDHGSRNRGRSLAATARELPATSTDGHRWPARWRTMRPARPVVVAGVPVAGVER